MTYDPPVKRPPAYAPTTSSDKVNWTNVAYQPQQNVGYKVECKARRDSLLMVYGKQLAISNQQKQWTAAAKLPTTASMIILIGSPW